MNSANLAEAIILQALEDLYETEEREGCVEFFSGDGFAQCAALAGMDHGAKIGLLEVVSAMVSGTRRAGFREICVNGNSNDLLKSRESGLQGSP